MTTDSAICKTSITKQHRYLLLTAALMPYLLITLGGVVCVTESGRGCPDWPRCFGQIIPPIRSDAIIEYLHRFIAALTTPVTICRGGGSVVGDARRTGRVGWIENIHQGH